MTLWNIWPNFVSRSTVMRGVRVVAGTLLVRMDEWRCGTGGAIEFVVVVVG